MTSLRLDRHSFSRARATLLAWSARQWALALAIGAIVALVVALPTAVIPNPVFGRAVAVTWWSYPTVALTGALSGMLVVTYLAVRGRPVDETRVGESGNRASIAEVANVEVASIEPRDRGLTVGSVGAAFSFFAVGCPVCNKLVLIALGASGAIAWFAPLQPLLAVLSVALLGWALVARLSSAEGCKCCECGECRECCECCEVDTDSGAPGRIRTCAHGSGGHCSIP